MWKRDEAVKPVNAQSGTPEAPGQASGKPVESADPRRHSERSVINIGKSVVIKGELNGSEDLTVEGHVEGTIDLRENVLTIGSNGNIKAQVFAKSVVVLGSVTGNITASEKIDIRDGGSVEGDLVSPAVAIAEGARFRGRVDMQTKRAQPVQQAAVSEKQKPTQSSGSAAPQQGAPMAAAATH
jgi:cytoskeletal protein CcmA (bactofilin family)